MAPINTQMRAMDSLMLLCYVFYSVLRCDSTGQKLSVHSLYDLQNNWSPYTLKMLARIACCRGESTGLLATVLSISRISVRVSHAPAILAIALLWLFVFSFKRVRTLVYVGEGS